MNRSFLTICLILVFILPLQSEAQIADVFLALGHRPGQYYLYGPHPDGGEINMRTDDYGRSVAHIFDSEPGFPGYISDAREGCLYGYAYSDNLNFWARSYDGGENWEQIYDDPRESGVFGSFGPATGRIQGEIYSRGLVVYTRYSTDYGDTYEQYRSENNGMRYIVGHSDGEVYCTGGRSLRRSTDYGRSFEVIFEGDDSTHFYFPYDLMKRGPEDGELYLFRPNTDARGYYLSYSDDHGESFTRLCRVYSPPTDYFEEWDYSFAPGMRAGEVSIGWLGMKWEPYFYSCLFIYFSPDYGRNWEIYETANNSDWHWNEVESIPSPPSSMNLLYNYPNPFNQHTTIRFDVPINSDVLITVIDLNGRTVVTLLDDRLNAGSHRLTWNAKDYPAGMYLCRMETGGFSLTRKLLLVR
ncbi:MAG: T9SS type A sorting domain-containing protein [Calditrichaeota bacterium]|nr:T9SS type A sorting domain-containing protein [Calditrichota bacterium]